ncbi:MULTISPECIES: acetyltransferase [unclassified Tamlana]|uniref:acetyltransferase n=1 Tax=unclassified Tamlana TaxID=2614803 RepID=UPI0026E36BAC|nr:MULTISPECIES: acetyltransferase [unclassified Tamlana]MDO6791366.1 acetyltransferase [Tamlana sp. 1_MG-2023]
MVLIGGGGHCKSCIDVIESLDKYHIIGILDLPSKLGDKILNYEVIGNDDDYLKYKNEGCSFLVTAGQIKSSKLRRTIFENLVAIHADIETIISSTATVSKYAKIGKGSVIMHHSVINTGAKIGENSIINTKAIIEHDVSVGNHCHISTNVAVNGDSKIGNNTFIGSMSCISNNVKIGDNIVLGAGSIVISDCTNEGVYAGTPLKKLK